MELPKRYDPKESEDKWQKFWEEKKVFSFDKKDIKRKVYSVDTPPPTVSGKMHLGHAFSYSQQDFVVRFHRMLGENVFYPFGTDNNGVATERLVEKLKKISAKKMARDEFVKICLDTVNKELKPQYVNDMKKLGLSCDFELFYDTINEHSMRISQRSFIDLYKKGLEYRKDAPTMWCPKCETGISQVECEDVEMDSYFNDIVFKVDGEDLIIATTRPELLPACVAVFYHPEDERYQKYKGKKAKVPLFDFDVPIMPDERADPEKGTGIVMCCTFGDQTDMEWQKAHNLPIKDAITKDGRMSAAAGKYEGMKISDARKEIIADMKEAGLLLKQEAIKHPVNTHERCGTAIEYMKAKQWFVKYLDKKDDMLRWGAELNWYPKHMKVRYDHWVKGLAWDWMISRQRYFGVPFPVWYCEDCGEIILAKEKDLPVDPLKDIPPVSKCPECGSTKIVGEKDVMDTWATSSLTPQIAAELVEDKEMQKKIYPMSLRPQAHDIITFWLFNTVVKSRLHNKVNPWQDVMIAGHAQDPHGKKMSKSKGNVVEPQAMIEKYSADALRFWAAGSKLGDDLPFQEKDLVTGQKFITKLWNASKFAFMHLEDYKLEKPKKLEAIDGWILNKLNKIIEGGTEAFAKYEYSKIKMDVEDFFWHDFCDNYLEIVKDRLYNPDTRGEDARISGQHGLYNVLLGVLKMMAPIMPFITEEIYQLFFKKHEKIESIHNSSWPVSISVDKEMEKIGDMMAYAVSQVRKSKSEKSLSLKTPVKGILVKGNLEEAEFEIARDDIISSTSAESVEYKKVKEEEFSVDIEF